MSQARPVALITGAARGIGRAIALDLARDHDIAVTYLTAADHAAALQTECPGALILPFDLLHDPAADLIAAVIARFGRLDALINNAGLVHVNPLASYSPSQTRDVMTVNATAPMDLIAAAAPHMQPGGGIVNITSGNARHPPVSAIAYGASKAALDAITKGCAKALGPQGIRVNAVSPGAIERDHAPRSADMIAAFTKDAALGRLATDTEIAKTVRFLLSDAASGITGHVIDVSAGYRL